MRAADMRRVRPTGRVPFGPPPPRATSAMTRTVTRRTPNQAMGTSNPDEAAQTRVLGLQPRLKTNDPAPSPVRWRNADTRWPARRVGTAGSCCPRLGCSRARRLLPAAAHVSLCQDPLPHRRRIEGEGLAHVHERERRAPISGEDPSLRLVSLRTRLSKTSDEQLVDRVFKDRDAHSVFWSEVHRRRATLVVHRRPRRGWRGCPPAVVRFARDEVRRQHSATHRGRRGPTPRAEYHV